MKSFKKLLAVVLSLAMVLGTLTVTAYAGNTANKKIDESGTYNLDGNYYGSTTGSGKTGIALTVGGTTADINVTVNAGDWQIYTKQYSYNAIKSYATNLVINSPNKIIYNYDVSEDTTGTTTEKGGNDTIYLLGSGTTTITAGTTVARVKSADLNTPVDGATVMYIGKDVAAVHLDGAIIAGKIAGTTSKIAKDIKSGYFYSDMASYVANGYECVALTTAEETAHPGCHYKVQEKVKGPTVCVIGEEEYDSFDAALTAAVDGDTIKLTDNCVKTEKVTTIEADTSITLDLNGKALTNTFSVSTGTNARYFTVAGTLTLKDSVGTGSITANAGCTSTAAITFAQATGTVNIESGTYIEGSASNQSCFSRANGGTYNVTGGWYTDASKPITDYHGDGYGRVEVTEAEKAATPFTVSNTFKTVNYSKNAQLATGTVEKSIVYYVDGYAPAETKTKTNQYSYTDYTFMGWSTDKDADPDSVDLIAPGTTIDWTQYGDEFTFFAIWKKVDKSMWVCVKTGDPEKGYADLAAALAKEDDVTLIKNITDRTTINASGTINLNGYNIDTTSTSGSALVIKGVVSIKNFDAGTITISGNEIKFGGEGIVKGSATSTGGAIEAGEGATVKIYGGTFIGYAPTHGSVLTCSKTGMFLIYGGTFTPSDVESEIDAFYANNSKIYVLADTQSDVKMTGTFAKNTSGEIGIQGGWFSELQPAAIVGTYDDVQGTFKTDDTKALIANTDDADYPYSVGATPWYVTYNYGTGTAPETANPTMIAKTDATEITLNAPTPAAGYTFAGFKDQDGNDVTKLQGTAMGKNLTLTAQYTAIEYTITYNNVSNYAGAVAPTQTTFTVEDNVTLGTATRPTYYFTKWTEGSDKGGEEITGWNAGEKTENVNVRANWSNNGVSASVTISDVTVAYKEFADAVAAVKNCASEATLKLLNDITVEARVDLGSQAGLTLDLNGKTLTETTATTGSGILIYAGALTITGNGKMVDATEKTDGNKSIVCQRKDATLTIESGTFEGFKKVTTNAVPKTPGAGATITGGTFSFNPTEYCGGLLVNYTAAVAEPATPESWTVTSTVAAAYIETSAGEFTSYKYMTGDKEDKSNYALDNIVNGDTVTLYKDAKATFFFGTEEKSFILDKNGFEYDIDNKFSAGEAIEVTATLVEGETDVYAVEIAEVDPLYVGGSIGASLSFDVYAIFRGVSENDEVSMKYVDPAADSSLPIDQRTVTVVATPEMKTKVIGQYKFTISGIYINHMADMYSFTFYVNDVLVDNMTKSTSVLKYYNELVAGEIVTEDSTLALLANTAVFAQQLQLYSNQGAPFTLEDWVTTNATKNKPTIEDKNVGRSGSHASVITGVRTIVSDKVMIEFIIDSLYLGQRVSLYKDGEKQLIDGNYYEFFAQNDGAGVSIKTDKIDPLDYDATYKIVITLSDGTVLAEAHTTVNNYCYSIALPKSTATTLEKSLVIGMYNFGKSFEAVFDSQN